MSTTPSSTPLKRLEKQGFEVTLPAGGPRAAPLPPSRSWTAIRPDTCLVTVMYANNEIGTILPIEEIGAVCREAGVLFHTDAVQAAGHLPIDVKAQHVDMLSLSGHKFHGPKGVGCSVRPAGRAHARSLIEGGAQERGKRAGTENVPGIAAMAAALEDACAHMDGEPRAKVTRPAGQAYRGAVPDPPQRSQRRPGEPAARQRQLLLRGH